MRVAKYEKKNTDFLLNIGVENYVTLADFSYCYKVLFSRKAEIKFRIIYLFQLGFVK